MCHFSSLLNNVTVRQALLDRTEFYVAPQRMAMRFGASEFKLLESQPSYAPCAVLVVAAFP
jgi:hypothetical protein